MYTECCLQAKTTVVAIQLDTIDVLGQEFVWQKVWTRLGVSEEESRQYFGGPAFLAWQRMGNIHSYAGPLPQSWINDQAGGCAILTIPNARRGALWGSALS